jgi:hypothetical protein
MADPTAGRSAGKQGNRRTDPTAGRSAENPPRQPLYPTRPVPARKKEDPPRGRSADRTESPKADPAGR